MQFEIRNVTHVFIYVSVCVSMYVLFLYVFKIYMYIRMHVCVCVYVYVSILQSLYQFLSGYNACVSKDVWERLHLYKAICISHASFRDFLKEIYIEKTEDECEVFCSYTRY